MDVGILGASGFLGASLASNLKRLGHNVVSFVREPENSKKLGASYVRFDFHTVSEVFESFSGLDALIHLVSSGTPASSAEVDYKIMLERNLLATNDLLGFLSKSGKTKLVFASSGGAVYGNAPHELIPEAQKTAPVSLYGQEKVLIENAILAAASSSGLDYSILRLANPYGPSQFVKNGQGLVPMIIGCALNGKPVPVRGDGLNLRDYVYIDDVNSAFLAALSHESSGLFNIGSGIGHSVLDLILLIEQVLGIEIKVEFFPPQNSDVASSVLDTSLARQNLGWRCHTSLLRGLEKTVDWYVKEKSTI